VRSHAGLMCDRFIKSKGHLTMERPGVWLGRGPSSNRRSGVCSRRNVNRETNRVCLHDARTVTVTKKSRLGIKHWG
jgi:hypothetical protein